MDDEITGMFQLAKILDELDEEARGRVLRWAADKYGIDLGQPAAESDEEDVESTDQTTFLGVDDAKAAAAKEAREAQTAEEKAEALGLEPPSAHEQEEAPPERDPQRPTFLDTSFRMYSGKQHLKKAKEEKR